MVSRHRFALLVLASFLLLAIARGTVRHEPDAAYPAMAAAVATAVRAQAAVGDRLIGPEYTAITTTLGPLAAKKLSLHPDSAALAVRYLLAAGIGPGDRVAVNFSGSFPAVNIAVLAAIQAIGAEPVITSSVGSSTWGASDPDYTWLDIEQTLVAGGIWPWRSAAASVGGVGDVGGGLTPEGVAAARAAIRRTGVSEMRPADLDEAVALRLAAYRRDGQLPVALVNVGGSHVIFGRRGHDSPLRQALTAGYSPLRRVADGLAAPFVDNNRPVIHFLNIGQLAAANGIEADNPPGTSAVMYTRTVPAATRLATVVWLAAAVWALWYGGRRKEWWRGPCR
ncbi:poly-gamma-glutamate system protein [Anaeroselena agilis]|uniref:Poly-gamma-glutamate system protein n=1 Tax=Anaeroselena agilis TaxID=3063788 RepID=A0ABU3P1V9_9FIRM|nr:poly-gamma-glutamate system protein [Selenomonadales bacterium 4137-cl]